MDPKMDPSMLAVSSSSFLTVDSLLARDALPLRLPPLAALGLLDEFVCAHLSFLEGYNLATNMFTCIYLHRRDLLAQRVVFEPPPGLAGTMLVGVLFVCNCMRIFFPFIYIYIYI